MYTYTNRKGVTYHLHAATTARGARYVFKRDAKGAIDKLPAGYEVVESVNGQPSVRRPQPRAITAEEESLVSDALVALKLKRYRVEVKGKTITVYEPDSDPDQAASRFSLLGFPDIEEAVIAQARKKVGNAALDGFIAQRKASVRDMLEKSLRYSPVMRFVLADADARLFDVERMTYSGDGGWQGLTFPPLPLKNAVKEYLRHLGKESFFELM